MENGQIHSMKTEMTHNDDNRIFKKSFVLKGMVPLPRGGFGNVRAFKVPMTGRATSGNRWS